MTRSDQNLIVDSIVKNRSSATLESESATSATQLSSRSSGKTKKKMTKNSRSKSERIEELLAELQDLNGNKTGSADQSIPPCILVNEEAQSPMKKKKKKMTKKKKKSLSRSESLEKQISRIHPLLAEMQEVNGNKTGSADQSIPPCILVNEEAQSQMKKKKKKMTKKKKKSSSRSASLEKQISRIDKLVVEMHELNENKTFSGDIPPSILVSKAATKQILSGTISAFSQRGIDDSGHSHFGTAEFYESISSKLKPLRGSICIREDLDTLGHTQGKIKREDRHADFRAAFRPDDMRCLALVSHNGMKSAMKEFVECHRHILKKFRLTGTQSTMTMLQNVFADEPDIVFGPSCSSGPLGGDAELVALMASGQLGGLLFFQDPMTAHPHQADIDCLTRQALVHNTIIATTPTTAMSIMQVFRMALIGEGMAELLPSFFVSLQSPSVAAYKIAQMVKVKSLLSMSSLGNNDDDYY